MSEPIPQGYADFATDTQKRYLEVYNRLGSYRAAEQELGLGHDTVRRSLERLLKEAARRGFAPGHFQGGTAPGYLMGKVTVQRGPGGEVERVWERQSPEADELRIAFKAAADAMSEELPRVIPTPPPTDVTDRLLNLYTFTDSHVGMLAWRKEGGDDWDLKIAERVLSSAFDAMVAAAPPARVGVLNQLGDFLHSDGLLPVTPTSGHILDQDGRFSKMVGIAIRLLRRIVDGMLARHEEVIVLLAEGNHDMASSVWLRHMFAALYENEPRVRVIQDELPYYAIQHGRTMLAFHHGHLKKPDQVPLVFAAQFPEIWGQTKHRYAHMGHMHHLYEREHGGMTVTQHPSITARDAYASRGGYFSERSASVVTYHDEFGQVAKNTVVPEMFK